MKLRAEELSRQGEWSVRQEILGFLRRNPGIVDTAEGIALRIYRDPSLTQLELSELCAAGYVQVLGASSRIELFALNEEPMAHGRSQAVGGERSAANAPAAPERGIRAR